MSASATEASKANYLWPVFLGLIGSLIAYIIVKDTDKDMARNVWIVGVVLTVLVLLVS